MAMVITYRQPCHTATPTFSPCQFHTFIFQTYNGNGYYLPTAMPYGYPYSFPISISHLYFCFTPLFFRPTMAMVITYRQPCHTATPTVSPCQFHTFIFQTYNGNGYYLPTAMPYGYPYSFPMSNSGSSSVPSNSNQTYFLDLPPATTMSSGKASYMVLPIYYQLQLAGSVISLLLTSDCQLLSSQDQS